MNTIKLTRPGARTMCEGEALYKSTNWSYNFWYRWVCSSRIVWS